MELNPVPVIIGIIVHSNMGGALTPIGDPISIIISTNNVISKNVREQIITKTINYYVLIRG